MLISEKYMSKYVNDFVTMIWLLSHNTVSFFSISLAVGLFNLMYLAFKSQKSRKKGTVSLITVYIHSCGVCETVPSPAHRYRECYSLRG